MGGDSFVRVWDVAQQLKVGEWSHPNSNSFSALAYAPRSPWLAVADWSGHVWLLNAADLSLLADWQAFDEGLAVTQIAWSADETLLATSGQDTAVRLWQVAERSGDLTEPTVFQELPGHGDTATDVAWSPDGTQVATGSHDQKLRVWQVADGAEVWQQELYDLVMSVAWSPAGFPLAAARYDGTVLLFDAANGREMHQLPGHIGSVDSLAWSRDGAHLASGSADGTVIIWGITP
ncbi:MAG: hypothetical protein HC804_03100 [Anaerolineae bacterium]|nr:hypothetical protein [Anaerolineae bacterium]